MGHPVFRKVCSEEAAFFCLLTKKLKFKKLNNQQYMPIYRVSHMYRSSEKRCAFFLHKKKRRFKKKRFLIKLRSKYLRVFIHKFCSPVCFCFIRFELLFI